MSLRPPRLSLFFVVTSFVLAGVITLAGAGSAFGGSASSTKTRYVVVYRSGVNPAAKAQQLGANATFLYTSALTGFSAELTPSQLTSAQQDAGVLMITDDNGNDATTASAAAVAARSAKAGPVFSVPLSATRPGSGYLTGDRVTADKGGNGGVGGGVVHLNKIPQIDSYGFDRVGGLQTPWIKMDGVDDRTNADIAVLDSGVDVSNDDLHVAGGMDCLNGTGGSNFQDQNGHGTRVAGIAAMIDNQVGGIGVATGARIWALRVLDSTLSGTESQVLCGIDWVAAHAGVIDVANMSFGGPGADDGNCGLSNHDPIHLAVCATVAKGVTMVTGAGNDFQNAAGQIPAAYGELITVSAISDSDGMPGGLGGPNCAGYADDVFAPFSNFGSVIDIAAPGVCIPSTNLNNTFYRDSGTSYATPFVSGAAALYKAHHPSAAPAQVRQAIIDAREQSAFPGDPDGINEGLLDLANLR